MQFLIRNYSERYSCSYTLLRLVVGTFSKSLQKDVTDVRGVEITPRFGYLANRQTKAL